MAAKFLGQFLLESGLIDRQQLLDALQSQRESNPLLGELARASGMLDAAQAEAINRRQRREDARFGDIACALGLLSAAQIEELLARQKAGRRLFGEILIDQGALSRPQLEQALQAHQHDRDEAVQTLASGVVGHPLGAVMDAAITTCGRLFPRLLKTRCQVSELLGQTTDQPVDTPSLDQLSADYDITACVHIEAARPMSIALACDAATVSAIAAAFLSMRSQDIDDALARDALGELVNVLMGYVVKDTLPDDADYRAEPPAFDVPAATLLQSGKPALAVRMASQLGPFALVVSD